MAVLVTAIHADPLFSGLLSCRAHVDRVDGRDTSFGRPGHDALERRALKERLHIDNPDPREHSMNRPLKVYLAGPEVFLPDAIDIGRRKKELCKSYGFEGLYPLDNDIASDTSDTRLDLLIFRACVAHMRAADFGIFNLTPFRGPSADAGTVFELGFFAGLAKPSFGYTNDADDLLARVRRFETLSQDAATGEWRDGMALATEDFGNADNLMIDGGLIGQGHPIIRHAAPAAARYHDLTGFEACLRQATEMLAVGGDTKRPRA
jgi:nucleoside 2-deoxyribosyltransferase